ncbi:hypothetical protein GQ42DRAFT_14321 [Ramicandelaber brevisporus]|nr:hypothetical protein GQ42DRAFT_14321 [Ramicandelaber brevisporus]
MQPFKFSLVAILAALLLALVADTLAAENPSPDAPKPPDCLHDDRFAVLIRVFHNDCRKFDHTCLPQCNQMFECDFTDIGLYDKDAKKWDYPSMELFLKWLFKEEYRKFVPQIIFNLKKLLKDDPPDHTFYEHYHEASKKYCDGTFIESLIYTCDIDCE